MVITYVTTKNSAVGRVIQIDAFPVIIADCTVGDCTVVGIIQVDTIIVVVNYAVGYCTVCGRIQVDAIPVVVTD